jgi:hypothetical protein
MSAPDPSASRERAQGTRTIAWPPGIVDEPDNCCVALRVRIAEARDDGQLKPLADLPRVAWGPALATLRELIAYRFSGAARAALEHEIEAIGWIDPRCPLILERVHSGKQQIFVEAVILPFGEQQAAELAELCRNQPDPDQRQSEAYAYAQHVRRQWEQQTPDGELPRRFLDVDFQVVTVRDAPEQPAADEALLLLERETLPASA